MNLSNESIKMSSLLISGSKYSYVFNFPISFQNSSYLFSMVNRLGMYFKRLVISSFSDFSNIYLTILLRSSLFFRQNELNISNLSDTYSISLLKTSNWVVLVAVLTTWVLILIKVLLSIGPATTSGTL